MSSRYLIITLAAPIASFGELAGHERRGGRERPGKAAIIGIVGAALGIRRDNQEGQEALRTGYDVAVRVDNPGTAMQDFHTAMYVPTARIKRPRTRALALQALKAKDNPEITRRDYRMDVSYRVAIEAMPDARWSLEELASSFERPQFALYLGRKSCPLSLPFDPWIVDADDILQALQSGDDRAGAEKRQRLLENAISKGRSPPYAAVTASTFHDRLARKPNQTPRIERVNDEPIDRLRWHFTERREAVLRLPGEPSPKREGEGQQ